MNIWRMSCDRRQPRVEVLCGRRGIKSISSKDPLRKVPSKPYLEKILTGAVPSASRPKGARESPAVRHRTVSALCALTAIATRH